MSIDLGTMYQAARLRITELATDDVGHLPVPATPMWNVLVSTPEGHAVAGVVVDLHTHEADLLQALGEPVVLPDEFLNWAARFIFGTAQRSLGEVS